MIKIFKRFTKYQGSIWLVGVAGVLLALAAVVPYAEASHAPTCYNGYCPGVSGSYNSGAAQGSVTVWQSLPSPSGCDVYHSVLKARWRSGSGAWQEQGLYMGSNWSSTFYMTTFNFFGLPAGNQSYEGMEEIWYANGCSSDGTWSHLETNGTWLYGTSSLTPSLSTSQFDIVIPPPVISSFTVAGGGQGPAPSITVPVNTSVTFDWTTSGTSYSCSSNGALGSYPSVPPQGPSSPVTATTPGGPFTQTLTCSNAGGNSAPASVSVWVTPPAPSAPTINGATCGTSAGTIRHGDTNTICWSAVSGASSYVVYIVPMSGGAATCAAGCAVVGTQLGPAANHTGVSAGSFSVSLTACNAGGCSTPSPSATFVVQSNDAAFVSETVKNRTIPPDQPAVNVSPNKTFRAEITFRNTGTATWDNVGEYVLRSQNPAGNTTWGISETITTSPPVSSVPPNATVTFAGDLPAPATAGIYNFQWQMYRKTNTFGYFGATSTNVVITVGGQPSEQPIQVRLQIRARQKLNF
ncbi:hypothetical protein HYZ80_00820 [Candidatus Parcubacteria bacterium]|nr:hypothetical protein [Candidatus Parcubacteria bacterium]